jgi:hypothetical protein
MGIIVQVETTAKPDYFICSWRSCEHNRDMECGRPGGPDFDSGADEIPKEYAGQLPWSSGKCKLAQEETR